VRHAPKRIGNGANLYAAKFRIGFAEQSSQPVFGGGKGLIQKQASRRQWSGNEKIASREIIFHDKGVEMDNCDSTGERFTNKKLKIRNYSKSRIRACSGFWFDGENEIKFAPMRHKKRSVAALHEHFCNEIGVNFSHL